MGSRTHSLGQGDRLRFIGRRTLPAILAAQGQRTADARFATYVGPAGSGLHFVTQACNQQQFRVGSALGGQTFVPGTQVLLGSNIGNPNEVIIAGPGAAGQGGSDNPVDASVFFGQLAVTPPSLCPVAPSGHSYLGIAADSTFLYAYQYTAGAYVGRLAKTDYTAAIQPIPNWLNSANRCHDLGDIILLNTEDAADGNSCFATWDVVGGAIAVAYPAWDPRPTPTGDGFVPNFWGPVWHTGSDIYFVVSRHPDFAGAQVYQASAGATGVVGTPKGTFITPDNTFAVWDGIAISSGSLWQQGRVFDLTTSLWRTRGGFPGSETYGQALAGCQVGSAEGAVSLNSRGFVASPVAGVDFQPFPLGWVLTGPSPFHDGAVSVSPDRSRLIAFPMGSGPPFSVLDIVVPTSPIDPACPEGPALILIPDPPSGDGPRPTVVLARD